MTTDYVSSTGPWQPYLERIAAAGFSHVHWCQEWNKGFVYDAAEVARIRATLDGLGLRLLDLHTLVLDSAWYALGPADAAAGGLQVIANRVRMTAALGSDTVILHPPSLPGDAPASAWDGVRRTFDRALEVARPLGVRFAIENLGGAGGAWDAIDRLLDGYGPDAAGICYDSGHGNLSPGSLERLERRSDRLISVHLHDNDGSGDQHLLPFEGTVDWRRVMRIIRGSSYRRPLSLESNVRPAPPDEGAWLARARAACEQLQAV